MEIQTTIKDFPSRIKKLGISSDTFIRVMIIPNLYDDENVHGQEVSAEKPEKSKWAKAAERIKKEAYLRGESEKLISLVHEFRENFQFKHDLSS